MFINDYGWRLEFFKRWVRVKCDKEIILPSNEEMSLSELQTYSSMKVIFQGNCVTDLEISRKYIHGYLTDTYSWSIEDEKSLFISILFLDLNSSNVIPDILNSLLKAMDRNASFVNCFINKLQSEMKIKVNEINSFNKAINQE